MEGLNPENFCFIDAETRATVTGPAGDLRETGVDVYQHHAFAIMWTWQIGEGEAKIMALHDGFNELLDWELDAPDDLKDFYERSLRGEAFFVAWNMGFDRHMWNCEASRLAGWPPLRIDMTLDAMAQGTAAGLPGKLEHASKACGFRGKLEGGSGLVQMFCGANGATPQSHPEHWKQFCDYGIQDTEELAKVFFATRMLPRSDWEDYWVSEKINERGFALDVDYAERAAAVAAANRARTNAAFSRLTLDEVPRVTNIQKLTTWVYDRLDKAEARDIMVKKWAADEEDDLKPAKLSLDKERLQALLVYFDNRDDLTDIEVTIVELLNLRLYGGTSSPAKFSKMLLMQYENVLRNQYTFNGAPQTGRFSSRGVQIHNLMRDSLGEDEVHVIEMINGLVLC